MALIIFFTLTGCAQIKQSLQIDNDQKTTKDFQKGLPVAYKGYYGRYQKAYGEKQFDGMKFKNDQFTFGKKSYQDLHYQQLDQNTYLIRGKNSSGNNDNWHYLKVDFKVKDDKTYLGLYQTKDQKYSLTDSKKVKKLSKKNITWYQNYSKSKYDILTGKTKPAKKETSTKTSLTVNDFSNSIFFSDHTDTEFLSFMASEDDSDSDNYLTLYNVTDDGDPDQVALVHNPVLKVKNQQLSVTYQADNQMPGRTFYGEDQPTIKYKIINKNKIKDEHTGYTYTRFDGNFDDAIYTIADTKGYPTDYASSSAQDSDDDSSEDVDSNDDFDDDED